MTMLKKGSEAWWIKMGYGYRSGEVLVTVIPVRITSWGEQQGTAIRLDMGGANARVRFFNDRNSVVATVEEVEARIAAEALPYAVKCLAGELDCCESNFPNLRPEFRVKAAAEIAKMKAMQPSVTTLYKLRNV